MKILYTSSTQTSELTSMTTPSLRDSQQTPSAKNNCPPIATTTNHASGSRSTSGKKMTRLHTSHENISSLQKNAGPSTTSIPPQTRRSLSSPPSSLPSLRQLRTHPEFLHSTSQKPVLAPLPPRSVSDDVPNHTHARGPLQHLFRPYPKLTPHLHPHPRLRLNNPYYEIRSTFDTSTNPQLCRQYKPMFQHHHNKLLHCTTSINIP